MKTRFCVLGILLLSVSFGMVAPQSPWIGTFCASKNPLLQRLKEKGVTVRPIAVSSSSICAIEWSKSGTCCDPDSASDFIQQKQNANALSLRDMLSEIRSLDTNMEAFLAKRLKAIRLPADYNVGDLEPSMTKVDNYFQQQTLPALKAATIELIKLLASWENKMVQDNQGCMKKLDSVVYAGTCSICSGRSEQFFQGGRIKMAEQTCRSILSECGSTWHRMVMVIEIIERYTSIIELVSPTADKKGKESFTKPMSTFSNLHNLEQYFGDCKTYEDCPFQKVSALCHNFVQVVGDSIVQKATADTIPALTKSPVIPSAQTQKLEQLFQFVVKATSSIIAQVDSQKSSKGSNPFFKEVMSFGTLIQYLEKLKMSILKTRSDVFKAHKRSGTGFEQSLTSTLQTCDSLLKRINHYLKIVEEKKDKIKEFLNHHNEQVQQHQQQKEHEYEKQVSTMFKSSVSNQKSAFFSSQPKPIAKKLGKSISSKTNSVSSGNGTSASPFLKWLKGIRWNIGNTNTGKPNTNSTSKPSFIQNAFTAFKSIFGKPSTNSNQASTSKPTKESTVKTQTAAQKIAILKTQIAAKFDKNKQQQPGTGSTNTAVQNKVKDKSTTSIASSISGIWNSVQNSMKSKPIPEIIQPKKDQTQSGSRQQPTSNPATNVSPRPQTTSAVVNKPSSSAQIRRDSNGSHHTAPTTQHRPAPTSAVHVHKPWSAPAHVVQHRPAPPPQVHHKPAPQVHHSPSPPVQHSPAPRWTPAPIRRKLSLLLEKSGHSHGQTEVQVIRDGDPTLVAPFDAWGP